jgi:hypothetical protein
MRLVIAAIAGTSFGYFVTHLPEWALRVGDRLFGEEAPR